MSCLAPWGLAGTLYPANSRCPDDVDFHGILKPFTHDRGAAGLGDQPQTGLPRSEGKTPVSVLGTDQEDDIVCNIYSIEDIWPSWNATWPCLSEEAEGHRRRDPCRAPVGAQVRHKLYWKRFPTTVHILHNLLLTHCFKSTYDGVEPTSRRCAPRAVHSDSHVRVPSVQRHPFAYCSGCHRCAVTEAAGAPRAGYVHAFRWERALLRWLRCCQI